MEELKEKIAAADYILIGVGEEWEDPVNQEIMKQHIDPWLKKCREEESLRFMVPYLLKASLHKENEESRQRAYHNLKELVAGKDYFVITTCINHELYEQGFFDQTIVAPCGSYRKLQCGKGCTKQLFPVPDLLPEKIDKVIKGMADVEILNEMKCPECGSPLTYNNINADYYVEDGYLLQWEVYKKWLQKTVNRKICIVELGVGMAYPTVIRWPFEKVACINEQASLIRVHEQLYQIPEEIKDKSTSIKSNSIDFLK